VYQTERECYGLEELLSDVGGLLAIAMSGVSIFTSYFSEMRTNAIFAEVAYKG
jgi:hypothetical protein